MEMELPVTEKVEPVQPGWGTPATMFPDLSHAMPLPPLHKPPYMSSPFVVNCFLSSGSHIRQHKPVPARAFPKRPPLKTLEIFASEQLSPPDENLQRATSHSQVFSHSQRSSQSRFSHPSSHSRFCHPFSHESRV
jgi:hypothetical protein